MIKILANDGLHPDAVRHLEENGFSVDTNKVEQDKLPDDLPRYDGIVVRSATKVRKDLIDCCPDLKIIARAGVGVDNIDVQYAEKQGIKVVNTPAASSESVAELAFAHMMTLSRNLHLSNRQMPTEGHDNFKKLKKAYSGGQEMYGKTLGLIGLGNIGLKVARLGYGLGMRVLPVDYSKNAGKINFALYTDQRVELHLNVKTVSKEKMFAESDFITIHVPYKGETVIGKKEIAQMKDSAIIINTSRGGVIDETALLDALDNDMLGGAGLDVFEGEPTPNPELLNHPKISVSPHIGASTVEAQRNIGMEIAEQLVEYLGEG